MPEWGAIREEYAGTGISLRGLAKKRGVSYSTLQLRASRERWAELRGTAARAEGDSPGGAPESMARERILSARDALLKQVERAAAELDRTAVKLTTRERAIEYGDQDAPGKPTREITTDREQVNVVRTPVDLAGLKQLAAVLKDLTDVAQGAREPGQELTAVERIMRRMDAEAGEDGGAASGGDSAAVAGLDELSGTGNMGEPGGADFGTLSGERASVPGIFPADGEDG